MRSLQQFSCYKTREFFFLRQTIFSLSQKKRNNSSFLHFFVRLIVPSFQVIAIHSFQDLCYFVLVLSWIPSLVLKLDDSNSLLLLREPFWSPSQINACNCFFQCLHGCIFYFSGIWGRFGLEACFSFWMTIYKIL